MNVLMVNTNRNRFPVTVIPQGACLVAQSTQRAGHSVRMVDMMFESNPVDALGTALKNFSPDVVGLSVRNIDNNDLQKPVMYPRELGPMVDTIKKHTRAPIVLGGAAVGVMPEELLRCTNTAWAVMGSGEAVFPELVSALAGGRSPTHLPGLAWIEEGQFKKNPISNALISDRCALPDFSHWVDMKKYRSQFATIPIQSKRGCPFDCIYCTYAMSEGPVHQVYTPESVADTIQDYSRKGFRNFEFVDNVFNAPYEHAMAICDRLAGLRLPARLQSLELNPRYLDDGLLTAMEKAGFVGIGITAESGSDGVLAGLRKGFTVDHVRRAAECVHRHNLPCVWIFMLGGPGETPATVRQTLDFAASFIHPRDIAFFNIGIRIYPGTPLEKIAREQKVLTLPKKDMLDPVFYLSPQLDMPWLLGQMKAAMAGHHQFLDSTSLSLPIVPWIYHLAYRLGVKPPIWKHTRALRRTLRLFGLDV